MASPTAPLSPILPVSGPLCSILTVSDPLYPSVLPYEEAINGKDSSNSLCVPYARWVVVNPVFSDSIQSGVYPAKLVNHFSMKGPSVSVIVNMESFPESRF